MLIGATDLLNNDANGNSFKPTQAPAAFQFGVIGSLASNHRYYLIPGTATIASLTNEVSSDPYAIARSFPIVFSQPSTIIEINITYTETLGSTESLTFNIYKNTNTTPVMTLTLTAGENTKFLTTQSVSFSTGDSLRTTLVTVGNPSGTYPGLSALVYYY
jgi:hypothetical protein